MDITIVIPVYNRAHTLQRTLNSVDAQSLRPAAVVLVDNGSTDGSLALMQAWASTRPWVKVVGEPRPGACAARNTGLRHVATEWTMFFDSDDEMHPLHLEQMQRGIDTHPGASVVGRDVWRIDAAGRRRRLYFLPGRAARRGDTPTQIFHHLYRACLATQRYTARTQLFREAGGWDETLPGWNDFELGLRLLLTRPQAVALGGEPTVTMHHTAQSITGSDFSSRHRVWEASLAAMARDIGRRLMDNPSLRARCLRWLAGVMAILAAQYGRESTLVDRPESYRTRALAASRRLMRQARGITPGRHRVLKLIYTHNFLLGRLTWPLARLLL